MPFQKLNREGALTEYLALTSKVLVNGRYLDGPAVEELEKKIAKLCDRKHAIAVGSGTDALFFAIKALPLEYLRVCPFTFRSGWNQVWRAGKNVEFVDLGEKADIHTQLFGGVTKTSALIEDACQAIGASVNGKMGGSFGMISCLSFDPTKVLGGITTGGMVLTNQLRIAIRVRRWRSYEFNSRMSELNAEYLLLGLKRLKKNIERRTKIALMYTDGLFGRVETPSPRGKPNWHKYVIQVKNRDELKQFLKDRGIGTKIHYDECPAGDYLPKLRKLSKRVLSLPIYPEMLDSEVEYVIECIKRFL